jgi:protease YdgD
MPPGSVHVLSGYAGGAFAHHAVAQALHVAPGFDPARPQETAGADLAVLTLAAPVAAEATALPLTQTRPERGRKAALAGYSQDRAEMMLADEDCGVIGSDADADGRPIILHGCAATRGTSGAPLLGKNAAGIWQVLGVQVGGFEDRPGGVAVPATAVAALLAER